MKRGKTNKRTLGIIYFVLLCTVTLIVVLYMQNTAAQYRTEATGEGTAEVAVWDVNFSGDGTTYSGSYDISLTPNTSDKVVSGKIAPGVGATGDGYIKLTGTETAVEFTIDVNRDDMNEAIEDVIGEGILERGQEENGETWSMTPEDLESTVADMMTQLNFSISNVAPTNASNSITMISNANGTYVGSVVLPENAGNKIPMTDNETIHFVVEVTWDYDSDSEVDTILGEKLAEISIPVKVTVEQAQ